MAGDVQKDDALAEGGDLAGKAQIVLPELSAAFRVLDSLGENGFQGLGVVEVKEAPPDGGQLPGVVDGNVEEGQSGIPVTGTKGLQGTVIQNPLHNLLILLVHTQLRGLDYQGKDQKQHDGDDGHIDQNKFSSQFLNQVSSTSK